MESILQTVSTVIGGDATCTDFDIDLILYVNSVFNVLWELGAGPSEGFVVTGRTETWSDFTTDKRVLGLVQNYVCDKVRLKFDPPQSSALLEALKQDAAECEYRIRDHLSYTNTVNDG